MVLPFQVGNINITLNSLHSEILIKAEPTDATSMAKGALLGALGHTSPRTYSQKN